MANLSTYFKNKIIDHLLRNQAFTPATTVYVALFTANTGMESNAPSAELSGGAYARKAISLASASGGATENSAELDFGVASADWGTITHVAIVDHLTNTTWGTNVNVLMFGALTVAKTVSNGDGFKILSGELDISFS